jgi:hypothetical protein
MQTFIGIVLVLLLLLGISVVSLRLRKLRRDRFRRELSALDKSLVVPPPSPYRVAPSFRVLPEDVKEIHQRIPEKPKLEASTDGFIFNDNQAALLSEEDILAHREIQFQSLAQSFEKSPLSFSTVGSILIAIVVAVFAIYYFH